MKKPFQIRVGDEEKAQWQIWADMEGVVLSEWIRQQCNKGHVKPTMEEFLALQKEKYLRTQTPEAKAEIERQALAEQYRQFLPKCAVPAPETTEDSTVDDDIEEARRKELERLKAGPDEEYLRRMGVE